MPIVGSSFSSAESPDFRGNTCGKMKTIGSCVDGVTETAGTGIKDDAVV